MTNNTYLSERSRPFLVNYIDDCIYDLSGDSSSENYLEVENIRKGLAKESKVTICENNCIDQLRTSLNESDIIRNAYSEWRNKQTELKNKKDEIKMINFIHEFFNQWSQYGPRFPMYEFPNEIAQAKTIDFKKFKLNAENDPSILKQNLMPDSASLFFISGKCYKLGKYDKKQSSHITMNSQKFSLQCISKIEEFDNQYFNAMLKTFEEKVKKFALTDLEQLKEVDAKYKALEKELKLDSKENGKGIGFMRKDGQVFLYISKDPYVIDVDGVQYGWFQKCKIGVRIMVKNGKYCYDFNGRRRPLIIDHDYYEHPAIYGMEEGKKENETFKNPTICVATKKYYYRECETWFDDSGKQVLIGALFELLHRLQAIDKYDKDAIVPHPFVYDSTIAKYKGLGVPKK